jgi:mannitol-1-phosphate/altronate dehydrogenase
MKKLSRDERLVLPSDISRPLYDLRAVKTGIVHIGIGGFQRSHLARYSHDLMNSDPSALAWGIAAAGLRSADRPLVKVLENQKCLYTLVERDAAGETRSLIGSITHVIDASESTSELQAEIARPETRIVSVTVSEAGYHLDPSTKTLERRSEQIRRDVAHPKNPRTMPGVLVEAYRRRREERLPAFTALSCDNIQHNGKVLRGAVLSLAECSDPVLAGWIAQHARFPSSMVDRITPVPAPEEIRAFSRAHDIADDAVLFCEAFRQWVIEDDFADDRPDWSQAGAQFVDDVSPYEAMKLRLLNTSHLAIAGLGNLLGCETVGQTMRNKSIRRYMTRLMDEETGPLLAPVPGIDLERYKATLIERFANPAIRDTLERINRDAPLNLLFDPLRDALAAERPIELLALGLAAWCKRVCAQLLRGEIVEGANAGIDLQNVVVRENDFCALLSVRPLFGDLGANERLARVMRAWSDQLNRLGIEGVLARV